MELRVRLFAGLRERAGAGELSVELPEDATVDDLLAALEPTAVGGLPPRSFIVAVNRSYASGEARIAEGDEVALIPPVSGGAVADDVVRVAALRAGALDVGRLSAAVRDPRAGAVVCFEGVTRTVERLEYEAYAEMAEPRLRAIAQEEAARHGLCAVAVEHRIGPVPLSEPSVVVAASAPHRGEAFAGARAVIDRLKAEAPIWKKEVEGDDEQWVEGALPRDHPGPVVVTVVDAAVPADREQEFLDGYRELAAGARPDGFMGSELLRGRDGIWRIQTTWRDMESFLALRRSGEPPAALALLDRLGAQHSHAVFSVETAL